MSHPHVQALKARNNTQGITMSQSLSQQWIHIIFSTKERFPYFKNPIVLEKLHHYIQGICSNHKCTPSLIGGVEDHVHILLNLNKQISLSTFIEETKKATSRWLKTLHELDFNLKKFYWQRGYAAFSVSQSNIARVKEYISNQKTHHKKKNFRDELLDFLNKHGVEYNDVYLWE
jgi:REP element-mobilizing transposase RayT